MRSIKSATQVWLPGSYPAPTQKSKVSYLNQLPHTVGGGVIILNCFCTHLFGLPGPILAPLWHWFVNTSRKPIWTGHLKIWQLAIIRKFEKNQYLEIHSTQRLRNRLKMSADPTFIFAFQHIYMSRGNTFIIICQKLILMLFF
jgi:hypothetical protein